MRSASASSRSAPEGKSRSKRSRYFNACSYSRLRRASRTVSTVRVCSARLNTAGASLVDDAPCAPAPLEDVTPRGPAEDVAAVELFSRGVWLFDPTMPCARGGECAGGVDCGTGSGSRDGGGRAGNSAAARSGKRASDGSARRMRASARASFAGGESGSGGCDRAVSGGVTSPAPVCVAKLEAAGDGTRCARLYPIALTVTPLATMTTLAHLTTAALVSHAPRPVDATVVFAASIDAPPRPSAAIARSRDRSRGASRRKDRAISRASSPSAPSEKRRGSFMATPAACFAIADASLASRSVRARAEGETPPFRRECQG